MAETRTFPIKGGLRIPWAAAERAYETYARHFGDEQPLAKIAERGGFGLIEWGILYMGKNPFRVRGNQPETLTTQAVADVFN